jgi:hypothetical protein
MAVSDPKVRAVFWPGGSPGWSAPKLWTVPPELARTQVFRATATLRFQTAPGFLKLAGVNF